MPSAKNSSALGPQALASVPFHDPEAARQNFAGATQRLSSSLVHALPGLLAESPDPDSSLLLLDRLLNEAGTEVLRLVERHPFLLHYAVSVFGHSRYLGETLIQNSDLLQIFLREKKLDQSFSRDEFAESLARYRSRSFERDNSLLLARFKRREYVRIMLRDVLKIAPLAETTAEISALSDVLIEEALREAQSALETKCGLPQHVDSEGRTIATPFVVLSLGKLGGNELNYSSDIDLLYIYGDGRELVSASISNREYFVRLAQQLTEILSRPTAEGPVFRIDLRLRPQGNEGELAISLVNALNYYAKTAHDWERQALIKVRYSAGNAQLAREFIRRVQPEVYTEKINFAAIKTALVAREKIDRKRRRQIAEGQRLDVKIDRGGIRDIEFLVQCLQRVYGGAEPWLRSGGTLFSLAKLHDKGHISGHDFHDLTSVYSFLRHLEHRLQLRQGQQVHRLPTAAPEREILRRSMEGLAPGEDRLGDLEAFAHARMSKVGEIYRRVIFQQQSHYAIAPAETEFHLQSRPAIAHAEQSHQQLLDRLREDAPELAAALRNGSLSATGRKNVFRVLGSAYASSERYAAVVRNQQAIANSLAVFESSEYLTEILVRHSEELNTLASIQTREAPSRAGALFEPGTQVFGDDSLEARDAVFNYIAVSNASHGEKIALLRRQFRHCMFASGARDIADQRPVYESLSETNHAAEDAVLAAFGIVGAPRGLAVCALGRLGSREFDLLSDADLLFICDEKHDRESLTRAAEQLMQALSAYTQDGMVFPVDARLRPHGAEGELLVTPVQLERYCREEAQPWEALTYTKLRFLTGNAGLARKAQEATETLFSRFAADAGFAAAGRQMRQRLQDASAPGRSIRTSAGALYDPDFVSSFLLVKQGLVPRSGTLRDRLWRCSAAGVLDKKDAAALDHAAELCRTVEHMLRLVLGRNNRWLPAAEHPRRAVEKLTACALHREFPEGLESELMDTFSQVREIYDRVVQ